MTRTVSSLSPVVFALLLALPLHGQAPIETAEDDLGELVTDRPDMTESSEVVGAGISQLEMGSVLRMGGGMRSLSLGTPLLRLGVSRRVEIRTATEGDLRFYAPGFKYRGLTDTSLGVKVKLRKQSRRAPALALISMVGIPTGAALWTRGRISPSLELAWSKDLPRGFEVAGNLLGADVTCLGNRFFQKTVTLAVGHDLVGGLSGFWEAAIIAPFDKGTGPAWIYDMGLTRMMGRNAQWDVTWGHRLNPIGFDQFVQVGLTIRSRVNRFRR